MIYLYTGPGVKEAAHPMLRAISGFEVRPNSWGLGMFSLHDIPVGAFVCPLGGPIVPSNAPSKFQVGADTWMGPSGTFTDQLNHGCDPNAAAMVEQEGYPVRAIRPIVAGEEVLIDYSVTSTAPLKGAFPCRCGAINCRGVSGGGFHSIPAWQQERYIQLQVVPSYVLDHYLDKLVASPVADGAGGL